MKEVLHSDKVHCQSCLGISQPIAYDSMLFRLDFPSLTGGVELSIYFNCPKDMSILSWLIIQISRVNTVLLVPVKTLCLGFQS